ncbi:MAG: hypothetical protein K0U80_06420 [Actinomycetia bacterium]|nr:hypothetical protein [Actinomycetes bacterium]
MRSARVLPATGWRRWSRQASDPGWIARVLPAQPHCGLRPGPCVQGWRQHFSDWASAVVLSVVSLGVAPLATRFGIGCCVASGPIDVVFTTVRVVVAAASSKLLWWIRPRWLPSARRCLGRGWTGRGTRKFVAVFGVRITVQRIEELLFSGLTHQSASLLISTGGT